jgi:hypothetical protein
VTLIRAVVSDSGFSIVGDTKLTFNIPFLATAVVDEAKTRQVYLHCQPKIAILREDLCVGVSGDDRRDSLRQLERVRDAPLAHVLQLCAGMSLRGFVVASLRPTPTLWSVEDGVVEEVTKRGDAWTGEHAAEREFRGQWEAARDFEPGLRELSASQHLTTWEPVASVGGLTMPVAGDEAGFRYALDSTRIWTGELRVGTSVDPDGTMNLILPNLDEDDPRWFPILCGTGHDHAAPTLAYLFPAARLGLVFAPDHFADPVRIAASGSDEFISKAAELGHHLEFPAVPILGESPILGVRIRPLAGPPPTGNTV